MDRLKILKPTRYAITIQFSPEIIEVLRKRAEADRRSMKNYAENIIIKSLESEYEK